MPKTLKLKTLATQIMEIHDILSKATTVQKLKKDGSLGAVTDPDNVDDAVKALKEANQMLRRVCQQGVLGVKVSP
jgi:hypothetical protein